MKNYLITSQAVLRRAFWEQYPQFSGSYRAKKRQNDYNANIRQTWVFFVDAMERNGDISEKLAGRAIL